MENCPYDPNDLDPFDKNLAIYVIERLDGNPFGNKKCIAQLKKDNIVVCNILYCPFCGTNLSPSI